MRSALETEIQKLIKSGMTLTEIKQRYDLKLSFDLDRKLVCFDYRSVSPHTELLVKQSRGLILSTEDWSLVAKPMDAFYEDYSKNSKLDLFNWESAYALPKYDGCMLELYYHKNEWCIGTRFVPYASWSVYTTYSPSNTVSWVELFKITLSELGYDFDTLTGDLETNFTYCFEVFGKVNRNVVIYENNHLKVISIVNKENFAESCIFEHEILNSKYPDLIPNRVKVNNLDEAYVLVENQDPLEIEGYVLIDRNFNRLKIRNKKYVEILEDSSGKNEVETLNTFIALDNQGITLPEP